MQQIFQLRTISLLSLVNFHFSGTVYNSRSLFPTILILLIIDELTYLILTDFTGNIANFRA